MIEDTRLSSEKRWVLEIPTHIPETEEYGISSFVFRDEKPFHPKRFWDYIRQNWPAGIIRSKGLFWLASRPSDAFNWSQAIGSVRAESAGVWWPIMSAAEREKYYTYIECRKSIEFRWGRFGDRMNELVLIGQDMDI